MVKRFICGLDIGAFKTCATCGSLRPSGEMDILATEMVPTEGLKDGRIVDSKKVSACVRAAIEKLRKICGIKVRRVYVNIDTPDLRAKFYKAKVFLGEKTKVKKSHIDRLIDSCVSSKTSLGRKPIHAGFRNFILDNRTNCIDPEGHQARDISLNIVIVSALIHTIRSLIKCVKDAGLIVQDLVPSGSAQALGFFRDTNEDREKSAILIDVGSSLTKITLLKDKLLKDITIIPSGAQSITEDIAVKLRLSFDCAEQLKRKYGRAFCENSFISQKIIVKDKLISKIIQAQRLYEIIALKVDYLLQETKKALLELDYEGEKVAELIVAGGGSIMEGFLERAEKILAKPVKMGFLSAVNDKHIQAHSALYATSIGLIHFGSKNRTKLSPFSRAKRNPLMHILNRGRSLYEEYF